ncbi:Pkinase-domain-containing protein [Pholiota conissans]|uniref:Pkinase-domain-containing protein n=1 Tax=Pholiota conissans TaxID=109636 RepID=A0A9P5YUH4_9AGAR|nr:Pkinase-domain-containing protein [Pholiota conissans]
MPASVHTLASPQAPTVVATEVFTTAAEHQISIPASPAVKESQFWGCLVPLNDSFKPFGFPRREHRITIGRGRHNSVLIALDADWISDVHCVFEWLGQDEGGVTLRDKSNSGTFINHSRIGRNRTRLVYDGDLIQIGQCPAVEDEKPINNRFIFRRVTSPSPLPLLSMTYDLGSVLGRGSFGVVRKALRKADGKWYAAKTIEKELVEGRSSWPVVITCLAREIQNMKALRHRNICRIYEYIKEQETENLSIIMEFVTGGNLEGYLRRVKMSEDEAKDIFYQTCDAMGFIHSKGIVHRDLKPENILLTQDTPPIVKIADFGLSKAIAAYKGKHSICGTANYAAPEVSGKKYDNKIDCYSLGLILFRMLTVSDYFKIPSNIKAKEGENLLAARIRQRAVISNLREGVSFEGDKLIDDLIEIEPRKRPSMKQALDHPWFYDFKPYYGFSKWEQDPSPSTKIQAAPVSQSELEANYVHALLEPVEEETYYETAHEGNAGDDAEIVERGAQDEDADGDSLMAPATPIRTRRFATEVEISRRGLRERPSSRRFRQTWG